MATPSPDENQSAPADWLKSNLPTTTVSGVRMAYVESETGYRRRYVSLDWLADEFRSQIVESSDSRRALARACERRGYETLQSLFTDQGT